LRREHKRSPRTEADADHLKAKTELLQIKIEEKKRALLRREVRTTWRSGATSMLSWIRSDARSHQPALPRPTSGTGQPDAFGEAVQRYLVPAAL